MTHSLEKIQRTVKNWWVPLLVGILLIMLAIYVLLNPVETLVSLSIFFAVMLLVAGVASMIFAWVNRKSLKGWGWNLGGGVLETVLGIVLLTRPGITMIVLTFILGFWLLFRGIYLISMAFEMRDYRVQRWGWVLAGGILTAVLAFFVMFDIFAGAVAISVWIGLSLLAAGLFTCFIALTLRHVKIEMKHLRTKAGEVREQL